MPDPAGSPASAEARHVRAAALAAEGWLREAVDLYRELQADNPLDLRAIGGLRDLYQRLGKAPELADQWLRLSDYRFREGRQDEAQRALARALQIHSGPDLLQGAAQRYLALGATRQAAVAYKRAAARWRQSGEAARAAQAWSHHLALRPVLEARLRELLGDEGPEARGLRALDEVWRLHACLGQKAEAARALWAAAELYEAEGYDGKAATTFRQASQYDRSLAFQAHLRRAAIYDRLGLTERTLREWERARGLLPSPSTAMH